MKVLHLTLKRKWFLMTDTGDKPEEYREITPYWTKRLLSNIEHLTTIEDVEAVGARFKSFDHVFARNGYNPKKNPSWTRKWESTSIGIGEEAWGAPPRKVFIIKLGEKL